jgi:anti-sigma B factor antagonist
MFRWDGEARDGVVVVAAVGTLDATSAADAKSALLERTQAARAVVVDLGKLELVDSSGVGVFISLFKRVRSDGGRVIFAGVKGQPREIFRLLRLDQSLDVAPTVDDAVGQLRG